MATKADKLESLTGGSGVHASMQGMALSSGDQTAFFPLDVQTYMRPITSLLNDGTRLKVVHDLKATLLAFHRMGITLAGPYMDVMVADYLLNPNRRDHQGPPDSEVSPPRVAPD